MRARSLVSQLVAAVFLLVASSSNVFAANFSEWELRTESHQRAVSTITTKWLAEKRFLGDTGIISKFEKERKALLNEVPFVEPSESKIYAAQKRILEAEGAVLTSLADWKSDSGKRNLDDALAKRSAADLDLATLLEASAKRKRNFAEWIGNARAYNKSVSAKLVTSIKAGTGQTNADELAALERRRTTLLTEGSRIESETTQERAAHAAIVKLLDCTGPLLKDLKDFRSAEAKSALSMSLAAHTQAARELIKALDSLNASHN